VTAGKFAFPVVDLDTHLYEPAAVWDHFVPGEYRASAKSALWHEFNDRGDRLTVLNGRLAKEINRSGIIRQAIWRPGMTLDDVGDLDPCLFHPLNPGASEAPARVADMDTLGIEQAVAYPTLFAEYFPLVEDPVIAEVLARAYNDWAWEMAAETGGRLHPVAVLPLQSLYLAQREMDRVAEVGFKGVALRPMFHPGRRADDDPVPSYTPSAPGTFLVDPAFRPLWQQIEGHGLVASIHASSGVTNPDAISEGTFIERVSQQMGIGHSVAETVAYMQDNALFLMAICFHGLMEDCPNLKLVMAHGGATMVPLVLEKAETYIWLGTNYRIRTAAPVSLAPDELFEEHPIVVQFDSWETGVADMPDLFARKAGWGSRYPNHDTSTPAEAVGLLQSHGVGQATIQRLMGGNTIDLFRLDVAVSA
jgi:predicted TIM-barrel fold metal-dependent hydrolase